MSMYLPNEDLRRTSAEAEEFVDAEDEGEVPEIERPVRTSAAPSDEPDPNRVSPP